MKTKLLLIAILFINQFLFSQNRKGQFAISNNAHTHDLYVAFENTIALNTTDYVSEIANQNPQFATIATNFQLQLQKGINISEEKLSEMEINALKLTGNSNSVKNLRTIFKIQFPNPTNNRILELATELEKLNIVRYCDIISQHPIAPPTDIAPATPNYEAQQIYIQPNPGVNMQYAWDLGFNGQGIRMRDVEYGFNKNHEENNSTNSSLAAGMTISSSATLAYTEHGTAVFGILYADKGTYGVSGMAHGATELILFPEWQQSGYSRVNAVSQAINNSTLNDVIVYEMQAYGATGTSNDFVPAEYVQTIWDLTKAATDSGIIIVAPAGNGNQNLDGSLYASYMSRGNSGAILVGAGTPDVNHNKISYSTYGSRIDLQAWGDNVRTIGKITTMTYFEINNDINQSYVLFGGTSSATPIVASCVVVLQSYYHSLFGSYMTGTQLRNLLKTTGIPQGTGGNIGELPNMQAAMQSIYNDFLSSDLFTADEKIRVYPNPAENQLNFATGNLLSKNATLEIFNAIGQLVYKSKIENNQSVDVSGFSQGIYMVKISDNSFTFNQKIFKK